MEGERIGYGDLRVWSDRRKGPCLFWVVPDVAPGFNVPEFYQEFIEERHQDARERAARRIAALQARHAQESVVNGGGSAGGR